MDISDFRARNDSRVPEAIEKLAYAVIGAAIEVHRELGTGLSEQHYKIAMSRELKLRAIPHEIEVEVDVIYKGEKIGKGYIDLLVDRVLIVELKTVEVLTPLHKSQALTYLKLKKLPLALLINFNTVILSDGIKRVINT